MGELTTDVRALVEHVVKMIVDAPAEVRVAEADGSPGTVDLSVSPLDVGKVIGKHGRTARALRNLVSASGIRHNRQQTLNIVEP